MARFFYNELGNRPVEINGRTYEFDLVSRSASVLKAEGDEAIADLVTVVGQRRGVTEISQEDYDKLQAQKKTTPGSTLSSSLSGGQPRAVTQGTSRLPIRLEQREGVAFAANDPKPEAAPQAEAKKLPDISTIAEVGSVGSPAPVLESYRTKKKP